MTEKKKAASDAMRFNAGKIRFNLIPKDALVELARVYSIGALKYDDNNWLKGMSWMNMVDCAERHFSLWQMGLTRDPDTKCHHLAQAAWNILGLLVYELRGLGTDDRTKLPIDENFNWIDGPAKELGLFMSPEEQTALREKYAKAREAHKAKAESEGCATAEAPSSVPNLEETAIEFECAPAPSTLVRVTVPGRLSVSGGPHDRIRGVGEEPLRGGDTLIAQGPSQRITEYIKYSTRPLREIPSSWFERGYPAELIRFVELFDPWHIDHISTLMAGKKLAQLSYDDRTIVLRKYTDMATQFAKKHGAELDPTEVSKLLVSLQESQLT